MPFYEEWISNEATAGYGTRTISGVDLTHTGFSNVDFVRLMTYRTRRTKNPKALNVQEIPHEKADPFAVFMATNRVKRDAAEKRGFSSDLFQEDLGHPFELTRYKTEGGLWSGSFESAPPFTIRYYRGQNLDLAQQNDTSPIPMGLGPVGWSDLPAYAQAAYAKAAPLPSSFSLGQFLGELPQGLPRFGTAFAKADLLSKSKTLKAVGDDYLNVTFGWIPFLSDLISAGQALAGATTALLGPKGPTHRERYEGQVESMRSYSGSGPFIALASTTRSTADRSRFTDDYRIFNEKLGMPPTAQNAAGLGDGSGRLTATYTVTERIVTNRWFEGSFTFIPKIGFNPDSYLDRLQELMNPEITPAVLWELAPWSWLVDWFVKIGDSIAANEVASDNRIISNYAYAMESRKIERGAILTNLTGGVKYAGPNAIARRWTTTGKRRIRANPFGFKPMTNTNLNPNQWMIMAALGLSRASR